MKHLILIGLIAICALATPAYAANKSSGLQAYAQSPGKAHRLEVCVRLRAKRGHTSSMGAPILENKMMALRCNG